MVRFALCLGLLFCASLAQGQSIYPPMYGPFPPSPQPTAFELKMLEKLAEIKKLHEAALAGLPTPRTPTVEELRMMLELQVLIQRTTEAPKCEPARPPLEWVKLKVTPPPCPAPATTASSTVTVNGVTYTITVARP